MPLSSRLSVWTLRPIPGKENFKGVQTPLDLAEKPAVVELLKKHGGKPASELK